MTLLAYHRPEPLASRRSRALVAVLPIYENSKNNGVECLKIKETNGKRLIPQRKMNSLKVKTLLPQALNNIEMYKQE